jgi:nucleoside phosphorylase
MSVEAGADTARRDALISVVQSTWNWPAPEAGFAKLVLASAPGLSTAVGALTLAAADRLHLDRAPRLAAGGYAYALGEAPRDMDDAWAEGLARLSVRDALPADRMSFAFEPLELVGIVLGALRCGAVDPASLRWLRQVVQQLEPLLLPRAVWNYLLSHWAAHLLGVAWRSRALPEPSEWAPEEVALGRWLARQQHELDAVHRLSAFAPPDASSDRVRLLRGPARGALVLVTETPFQVHGGGNPVSTSPDLALLRVGIVTALPEEFAAVRAMLADPFEPPVPKHVDPNPYVLGWLPARDGRHLVAVTIAPKMGNNTATGMTTHLLRTFSTIRDVLMVGIAGGVPNPANPDSHVRLGDIVVSSEQGVVQYDNIKLEAGKVEVRDTSSPPAAWLVAKIKSLEARRLAGERPWESWIARGTALEGAARPAGTSDVLVDADGQVIPHPDDSRRVPGQPRLHYGRIASANTLLKNRAVRDALRRDHRARAVEMEGSGIADGTWASGRGYLVIRGICDYCDDQKNDLWHGYAAVVAAAYAAALLASTSVQELA